MTDENPAFIKRVKRQVSGKYRECFAVTAPGFEKLTASELGVPPFSDLSTKIQPGGVDFSGRLIDLMYANLHLRIANRILMRLTSFKAEGFLELQRKLDRTPWELYLYRNQNVNIHVTCRNSRIYHSDAVAQRVEQSISDRRTEMIFDSSHRSDQHLFIRILKNRVTLSIDSSGEPLFKRGIKNHGGPAPLRETFAAGILKIAGYCPCKPLIDPMCGSGTFSLEAAMTAKKIAAGLFRSFAFVDWPAFQPKRWNYIRKTAKEMVSPAHRTTIFASDNDQKATDKLSACLKKYDLTDAVCAEKKDFFDINPEKNFSEKGLLVLNPPYGVRLSKDRSSETFFSELVGKLKSDFKGWRVALLAPRDVAKSIRRLSLKSCRVPHGGLDIILFFGEVS